MNFTAASLLEDKELAGEVVVEVIASIIFPNVIKVADGISGYSVCKYRACDNFKE
jgi:hypothetical protein